MGHKILVTGGTGYIGSHTAVSLIEAGFEVFIVDNLSNSNISVLDGIEKITGHKPHFEKLDLKDQKATEGYFKKHHDLDGIIHFAAFKAVGESVAEPTKYYRNNLVSLINILDSMISQGIPHIVFSSSCTVYGQPDKLPVNEDAPVQEANSPYGNTKQISEEMLVDSLKAHTMLRAIALRYFNPIGAHESGLIGELPVGTPNNLVPFITQTAAGLRDELKVFGDDYDTPDGTCIRDYIHVTDLANAHVTALRRMTDKKQIENFEVFNIGTGKGLSVLEIIRTFQKTTGLKIPFHITERRAGDVEQVWADTSRANKELGWKAVKTLEECLSSAWRWEKNYRGIKD